MDNDTTDRSDLRDPVWTIQHLAACFHVAVDTAREYTYRDDFPGSHRLGARLLWDREAVLNWFRGLPVETAAARRRAAQPPVHDPVPARRGHAAYRRRPSRRAEA